MSVTVKKVTSSLLSYTFSSLVFGNIMKKISEQHLRACGLCTCREVHICTWLSCLFGQVNST